MVLIFFDDTVRNSLNEQAASARKGVGVKVFTVPKYRTKAFVEDLLSPSCTYDLSCGYADQKIAERCGEEDTRIIDGRYSHHTSISKSKPLRLCGEFIKPCRAYLFIGLFVPDQVERLNPAVLTDLS